jgi:AcrR family transcriptional regulator
MADRQIKTRQKLIQAVGTVLAKEGFKGLGINKIAKTAGVDKVLVYRYFNGLPGLVAVYSETVDFWPTAREVMGPDPEAIRALEPDMQMAHFFKSFLAALRRRPVTQDILAWELLERNELSKQLEQRRIHTALEFFEQLESLPDDENLPAILALMAGAVNYLIVKSRISCSAGSIDLGSDSGWGKIDKGIDLLLKGVFTR